MNNLPTSTEGQHPTLAQGSMHRNIARYRALQFAVATLHNEVPQGRLRDVLMFIFCQLSPGIINPPKAAPVIRWQYEQEEKSGSTENEVAILKAFAILLEKMDV